MARKTHKAQHFVPECYLKAWCDPATPAGYEPYLWMFDPDGQNPRRRAPMNVFTETDIYTIQKLSGERDLRLEHGLSGLESTFTTIRDDKLNRQLPLDQDEHLKLAVFVAAAQMRTQSARDHHAAQWGEMQSFMDETLEAMRHATPEQRESMERASSLASSSSDRSLTYEQVRHLAERPLETMLPIAIQSVTPILMRMGMLILCTDDPTGFVTTDQPVTWFDPDAYRRPPMYRAPALGSRTIEVSMPLSPQQCVVFAWNAPTGYLPATALALHELNRRHIGHCRTTFTARTNTTNPIWFARYEPPNDAWEQLNPDLDAEP